jgi:sodium-independent sulfate anion transporter 11
MSANNNKYIPAGVFSFADSYQNDIKIQEFNNEKIISSSDYTKNLFKNPGNRSLSYLKSLFPFMEWFPHYPSNINWILSDFITGVTVAIVLVPQSMSYAKLANLQPEFGLYSAFIGLVFYFMFATSREICIGPVAVLSTEVGKVINRIQSEYPNEYNSNEIATTLALICGGIVLGIGLLRLGFIVEFLSLPAIMAFTTGSAINIVSGQLAGLMGFSKQAGKYPTTYQTLISFLKHLPDTKIDAAFGLIGLFILYLWQFICDYYIEKYKNNKKKKLLFIYILNLRTAFVIIISTCISFGIIRYYPKSKKSPYSIIGVVPSGLKHVGKFTPPPQLASRLASDLPITTIVLVLEHISISKSFARLNGYRVNPNQEFVAIGLTNMIGTFFGAYPVTGSFSRTALSAKCGVKTPFKSTFSGVCVLLAIYCFTSAFYYIPNATLCAIIIHCVTNLVANYKFTTKFYMFSPIDFFIFIIGVFITIFASIEDGIYWALCASAAQILWRLCIPNGTFLGRIKVATIRNPILIENINNNNNNSSNDIESENSIIDDTCIKKIDREITKTVNKINQDFIYKWVPLPKDSFNPSFVHTRYINNSIDIEQPPSGILVYRMSESFVYTNCSLQIDQIIYKIRETFKPFNSDRERLWCEYTFKEKNWNFNSKKLSHKLNNLTHLFKRNHDPHSNQIDDSIISSDNDDDDEYLISQQKLDNEKPVLRILHLDFSQVIATDASSIQSLIDLQNTINNFVGFEWEMHFSGIINPWVLRSLINAGFGSNRPLPKSPENDYLKKNLKKLMFWNKNNNKNNIHSQQKEYEKNSDDDSIDIESQQQNYHHDGEHPEYHNAYSQYHNAFEEEVEIEVPDDDDLPIEITPNEKQFDGDLEVGINNDGTIIPLYSTEYPNFHLDIPSYSEYQ